ncbi:OmpA/MotB family protein [Pseudomonas oligotrophica]|uniref:OmpA/MotB family protein n=1 Tax=Pseudomonas oligotrophica TaxID=2912055 RepID=UPI001F400327|nr:OmpA family protein [Pseudomonas oligotrophica]MCF7202819.1 OmpA family protein [Pseudomonas oligotrophica]
MNGSGSGGGRFGKWHVEPPREEEQEGWLLTYLDTITLLLVMLVVLLALAGQGERAPVTAASAAGAAPVAPAADAAPLQPIIAGIAQPAPAAPEAAWAQALGEDIEVVVNQGSVSFRISSELLFASAEAELADAGLDVLDRLLPTLAAGGHRILVEGHTDDVPISGARFPSNWELSAARASSVVRYLQLNGIAATRMSATGFAETRPLGDNATADGRARNRRVELVMQTAP